VSADLPPGEMKGPPRAVRVQAVFHVADDQQAQTVAAKMVDRAHEIANLPECECDVDVSIERARPDAAHPVDPGDAPPNGSLAPVGPTGAPLRGRAPNS
jgi:hypothetical protein